MDLIAFVSPVAGCVQFLKEKREIQEDTCVDGGPSQIWIMSYAILFLYVNIVSHLREIRDSDDVFSTTMLFF